MNTFVEQNDNPVKYEAGTALVFTIGVMVLFFWLGSIRYEVNDDIAITALVKGLFGLAPSAEGIFISPFLGGVLSLLYKALPAVPWFSLLLYIGLAQSFFLASLTILAALRTVAGKIAGLLGIAALVSLTAFQINFAAVSLLLWVTGCAFFLHAVRHNAPVNTWFWLAASQLAVGYLLRPSLLTLFLILAVPLFLTLLLAGTRSLAGRALAPLVVALLLSLLSAMVIRQGDVYPEYLEFNKIRSEFNDTARGLKTPRTPQALFAAKWSYEDYLLARNWWLYDGTFFNTEQIKAFLEVNAPASSIFDKDDAIEIFSEHIVFFEVILFWGLVVLWPNKLVEIKKIRKIDALLYLFLISVVLLMMGIRFPQRVAYPCFVMLFLNLPIILDHLSEKNSRWFFRIVPPLAFIVFLAYVFIPMEKQKNVEVNYIKNVKRHIERSLISVLDVNGPDSIIVDVNPHMLPTTYLPFEEDADILRTRSLPGGWLVGSPAYLDFLKKESLGDRFSAVAAMIDNRRMVLRFWDSPPMPYDTYVKYIFLRYLHQHYGAPENGRFIDLKILKDLRQGRNGLVYFQLVTTSAPPSAILQ